MPESQLARSTRQRIASGLAAISSLALATAGLSVASSTAAFASGLPSNNGYANISVSPDNETPGIFDAVTFTVELQQLGETDCATNQPAVTWSDNAGGTGALTASVGDGVLSYTYTTAVLGNGAGYEFVVMASGGCVQPDTETSAVAASSTVTTPYYQGYVYGYALTGTAGATQWSDTTRTAGVVADLMDVDGGVGGEPVTSVTTQAPDAGYVLYAPMNNPADLARSYKVRFTYPTGEVLYYDSNGAPWTTSTSNWGDATVGGPSTWGNTVYSIYLAAPVVPSYQYAVHGHALQWIGGSSSYAPGTVVDLISTVDGQDSEPYAEATTDENGVYDLTAPSGGAGDALRTYKLRFTFPNGSVVWYSADLAQFAPSPSNWDDATAGGPASWPQQNYDASLADPASTTNASQLCTSGGTGTNIDRIETQSSYWTNICATDPSLNDAGTGRRTDAFDGFGRLWLIQGGGHSDYYVTADTESRSDVAGRTVLTLTDNDIYLPVYSRTVDVTVIRTFAGSFVRWVIEVRDHTTHALVDVPFDFFGNVGSDQQSVWSGSGEWRVSHDTAGWDPILTHSVSAAGDYEWQTTDSQDQTTVLVSTGGTLTYTVGMLDYSCLDAANVTAAETIAQSVDSYFGSDLDPLTEACPTWDWTPDLGDLTVGIAYDETFQMPAGGPWDWSLGGDISVLDYLPDGLGFQILNSWNRGYPPSIRIFGTPTSPGDTSVAMEGYDAFGGHVNTSLGFTVLDGPVRSWSPTLGELRVGVPFDATISPTGDFWDWTSGGGMETTHNLPAGLQYEIVDAYSANLAPALHIFGTPTTAGAYNVWIAVWDANVETDNNGLLAQLTGTVLAPLAPGPSEPNADFRFGFDVGDDVAGGTATATGEGMQPGADYTIILHSSPILLASGHATVTGSILTTVTIPSGLEVGWHSITLTTTANNGSPYIKVVFRIGANGTLLQVSYSAPGLASTGTDPSGNIALGGGLFVIGLLLMAARRRRPTTD
ncbi:MAG: hypothetical protein JWP19_732 [Rhodoglobus sp.]|nr:hypothetical protein [Rhodoglobus sp.]